MRSTDTAKQLISDARMLGNMQDTAVFPDSRMITSLNLANQKIFRELNKANRFCGCAPLGTPAGYISIVGTGTYTATTSKIADSTMDINDTYIGGLVIWYGTGIEGTGCHISYVTAVQTATEVIVPTVTVASGPSKNYTTVYAIILKKPAGASHSVDGYRIDKLRGVEFPTTGDAIILGDDDIEQASSNPSHDNDLCVNHYGNTIKVVGTATSFPVAFYEELPYWHTAVADYVDLPPEFHLFLLDEMVGKSTIDEVVEKK